MVSAPCGLVHCGLPSASPVGVGRHLWSEMLYLGLSPSGSGGEWYSRVSRPGQNENSDGPQGKSEAGCFPGSSARSTSLRPFSSGPPLCWSSSLPGMLTANTLIPFTFYPPFKVQPSCITPGSLQGTGCSAAHSFVLGLMYLWNTWLGAKAHTERTSNSPHPTAVYNQVIYQSILI